MTASTSFNWNEVKEEHTPNLVESIIMTVRFAEAFIARLT